jgi:hypothetical protein
MRRAYLTSHGSRSTNKNLQRLDAEDSIRIQIVPSNFVSQRSFCLCAHPTSKTTRRQEHYAA